MGPKLFTEDEVRRIAAAAMLFGEARRPDDDEFFTWATETRGQGGFSAFVQWAAKRARDASAN